MSIISNGYRPHTSILSALEQDWQLFAINFDLIRKYEQNILNCCDYFFCSPSFSHCSWPYLEGDGQLFLGYLLLGWRAGILTEDCPDCKNRIYLTSFAGSMLTGSNSFTGLCLGCYERKKGKDSSCFRQWMDFILQLRKAFPDRVQEEIDFAGQEFTWAGNGLKSVIKTKIVWHAVAEPVDLTTLVEELRSAQIRQYKPANVCLLKQNYQLKFSTNGLNGSIIF